MLRSLFSGISGLRAHQTMMDVVGNNIANVNTTGYKASSTIFEDTLSQMMRASGAPSGTVGGVNPAQIGLGVQLGAIDVNFSQGSAQSTGRATDLMIEGDGFFTLRNGTDQVYTRAGDFTFDTSGKLVNSEGMYVQGYPAANGVVNTNGAIGDITLPAGSLIPPVPSTSVTVAGNLPSDLALSSVQTLGPTAYDEAGNAHSLIVTLTKSASDTFDVEVDDTTGGVTTVLGTGQATFNPDGTLATNTDPTFTLTATGPTVTVSLAGLTEYGGPKTVAVTDSDGSAAGSLQQFQISADGTILGLFSNGKKLAMAQVALANFNNPQGLEKIGNTSYRQSPNSGLAQVGTPQSGGRGELLASSLEMSNVDLAQEFTSLIIAQRGFQANSKVITSSDEMLQDLVNIKR